jgi:hypothetical protein
MTWTHPNRGHLDSSKSLKDAAKSKGKFCELVVRGIH